MTCIPMTVLETKDLKKYYGSGDTQVKALDGVDLMVENGEFVAIVGTSGSGKSTLLHMLGGLDRPTGGSVLVEGRDIFAGHLRPERRGADHLPPAENRLCVPVLQPGPGAQRL